MGDASRVWIRSGGPRPRTSRPGIPAPTMGMGIRAGDPKTISRCLRRSNFDRLDANATIPGPVASLRRTEKSLDSPFGLGERFLIHSRDRYPRGGPTHDRRRLADPLRARNALARPALRRRRRGRSGSASPAGSAASSAAGSTRASSAAPAATTCSRASSPASSPRRRARAARPAAAPTSGGCWSTSPSARWPTRPTHHRAAGATSAATAQPLGDFDRWRRARAICSVPRTRPSRATIRPAARRAARGPAAGLRLRLEGYTNAEIAAQIGRVERTVELKLRTIRGLLAPHLRTGSEGP